jgi:hypothetical protein
MCLQTPSFIIDFLRLLNTQEGRTSGEKDYIVY